MPTIFASINQKCQTMIKKLIFLSVFGMSCIASFGQTGTVTLYDRDPKNNDKGHRNEIPVVTYNDDVINITSEVDRPNAQVVITGKLGEVLYYGNVTLSQSQTTIVVPNNGISEKDTIELYCDEEEYYGEFEE